MVSHWTNETDLSILQLRMQALSCGPMRLIRSSSFHLLLAVIGLMCIQVRTAVAVLSTLSKPDLADDSTCGLLLLEFHAGDCGVCDLDADLAGNNPLISCLAKSVTVCHINIAEEEADSLFNRYHFKAPYPACALLDRSGNNLASWDRCPDQQSFIDSLRLALAVLNAKSERLAKAEAVRSWRDTLRWGPEIEGGCVSNGKGVVYVMVGVDTETYQLGGVAYAEQLDLSNYSKDGFTGQAMQESFRDGFGDSGGNPIRFTWFMMTSEQFCLSRDSDCLVVHDALVNRWSGHLQRYGDELQLHYHNVEWSDRDGDGVYHWNQKLHFDRRDLEKMISYLLTERQFFPSAFRAGWTWEDNDLSRFLEEVLPFDFSGNPLLVRHDYCRDPVAKVFDWTRASTGWGYYHPSNSDYQTPGNLSRSVFPCLSYTMFNTALDAAFSKAANGQCAVLVSDFLHNTTFMFPHLRSIHSTLVSKSDEYDVDFLWVTAAAGARIAMKSADTLSPVLVISEEIIVNEPGLLIESSEVLFAFPYVVAKNDVGEYARIYPKTMSDTSWAVSIPRDWGKGTVTITVGACDPSGNTSVNQHVFNSAALR